MNFLSYFLSNSPKDWNIRDFVEEVLRDRSLTDKQITTMYQDSLDKLIKMPTLSTTARKRARELKDVKGLGYKIKAMCEGKENEQECDILIKDNLEEYKQDKQEEYRQSESEQVEDNQAEDNQAKNNRELLHHDHNQLMHHQPIQTVTNNINSENFKQTYKNIYQQPAISNKIRKIIIEPVSSSKFNEKFNDADIMNISNTSLTLNKDGKTYIIRTPSTKLLSPNKPKIEVANQKNLKEFCIIGNRTIATDKGENNMTVYKEYQSNIQDQSRNSSLRSIPGVISFLTDVLGQEMDHFMEWIANYKLDPPNVPENHHHRHYQQQQQFVSIMKYALIDFHCNCQSSPTFTNHERTAFVEYIIPSLKAISKVTGLLQYTWCEKQLDSNKFIQLCHKNYKNAHRILSDGVGKMNDDQEKMIIEVSKYSSVNIKKRLLIGFEKEDVKHSLEDTIKLIEAAINTLLTEMSIYKEAGINTFRNVEIYSIQVIKNRMTMYSTSVFDKKKWKHVELRSAIVPTSWNDISLWVKFFELLATLMIKLKEQQDVYTQLQQEITGLVEVEGEAVRDFL